MQLAIATYHELPHLSDDCRLLLPALEDVGFEPEIVDWQIDDPPGPTLLRSVWNYYQHRDSFLAWLEGLPGPVINSAEIVRWNSDKNYLTDLAIRGVAIVPSVFFPSATREDAERVITAHGWGDAVIKPTVSANAWRTLRIRDGVVPYFREYDMPVVIQPFLREVETAGEWSLVFFGGEYSHAVLKRPKDGDFRVQDDHGGTVESLEPDPELIKTATQILKLGELDKLPYARVDGVVVDGGFYLMELELIEPELFFRANDEAAPRFARVLADQLLTTNY